MKLSGNAYNLMHSMSRQIVNLTGALVTLDLSKHLKKACRSHSSADAHRDNHIFYATAFAFDQGMTNHTCT